MDKSQENKLYEILFSQMVLSLNEAAMIQMGKLVDPNTQQTSKNFNQARGTIDLLRMLKEKTKNNLNEKEQTLLEQCIINLQINFVKEQENNSKEQDSPEASKSSPEADKQEKSESKKEEADIKQPKKDDSEEGEKYMPGQRPSQDN